MLDGENPDGRMDRDPKKQKEEAGAGPGLSADLPSLEQFVRAWTREGDDISTDGSDFNGTNPWASSPVDDVVTKEYFDVLSRTHGEFISHNGMMVSYSEVYREKFAECLRDYQLHEAASALLFPMGPGF